MYEFNTRPENWNIKDYAPGTRHKEDIAKKPWGLGRARRLLTLAYNLAFSCLLRFDEVLKIQAHDITVHSNGCLEIRLPYRKTSQFGGMCE